MASVKFSALVTGIKGVLNGSIFQSNPTGYVVRTRTNGTSIASQPWQSRKNAVTAISAQWRELTPTQRTSFETQAPSYPAYDKFGNSYTPSAYQLYMTLNLTIFDTITSVIDTAITPAVLTIPSALVTSGTWAVDLKLSYTGLVTTDERLVVYASPIQSNGRAFRANVMRKIATFTHADGASNLPLSAAYEAIFYDGYSTGTIYFYVKVVNVTTGQQGMILPFVVTI